MNSAENCHTIDVDIVGLPAKRSRKRAFERETVRRAVRTYLVEKLNAVQKDIRVGFVQQAEGAFQDSSVIAYVLLTGVYVNPAAGDFVICSEMKEKMSSHVYNKVPFAFLSQGVGN